MITLMSFEEWEAAQDIENNFEWGSLSGNTSVEAKDNKMPFKYVPKDIRRMFYSQYIHEQTNNR